MDKVESIGRAKKLCKGTAYEISGHGRFALVSKCGRLTTIHLNDSMSEIIDSKALIDGCGCGSSCVKAHYIHDLKTDKRINYMTLKDICE